MSGAAETYPVSEEPKHKVYGAADSQDVGVEPGAARRLAAVKEWRDKLAATKRRGIEAQASRNRHSGQ